MLTEAVCMAANPPPSNSAMATKPSIKAQKIRCPTGASNFPPEVILSITKEPLSEEVTKNTETINIPNNTRESIKGKVFKKINSEVEASFKTGVERTPGFQSLVKTRSQKHLSKKVINVGTNKTPKTNSLKVLPFDIRAINIPTKEPMPPTKHSRISSSCFAKLDQQMKKTRFQFQ